MRSLGISLSFALFLVVLIPVAESAQKDGLAARVAQLEAQVAAMEEILQFVHVETEVINNLAGPHLIIEGAISMCGVDQETPPTSVIPFPPISLNAPPGWGT